MLCCQSSNRDDFARQGYPQIRTAEHEGPMLAGRAMSRGWALQKRKDSQNRSLLHPPCRRLHRSLVRPCPRMQSETLHRARTIPMRSHGDQADTAPAPLALEILARREPWHEHFEDPSSRILRAASVPSFQKQRRVLKEPHATALPGRRSCIFDLFYLGVKRFVGRQKAREAP